MVGFMVYWFCSHFIEARPSWKTTLGKLRSYWTPQVAIRPSGTTWFPIPHIRFVMPDERLRVANPGRFDPQTHTLTTRLRSPPKGCLYNLACMSICTEWICLPSISISQKNNKWLLHIMSFNLKLLDMIRFICNNLLVIVAYHFEIVIFYG